MLFLHIALRKPKLIKQAISLANEWMEMGTAAGFHLTIRVEDYLDRPDAELREMVLAA